MKQKFQIIIYVTIESKRGAGRSQTSLLQNIKEWRDIRNTGSHFGLIDGREASSTVIADVWDGAYEE